MRYRENYNSSHDVLAWGHGNGGAMPSFSIRPVIFSTLAGAIHVIYLSVYPYLTLASHASVAAAACMARQTESRPSRGGRKDGLASGALRVDI